MQILNPGDQSIRLTILQGSKIQERAGRVSTGRSGRSGGSGGYTNTRGNLWRNKGKRAGINTRGTKEGIIYSRGEEPGEGNDVIAWQRGGEAPF